MSYGADDSGASKSVAVLLIFAGLAVGAGLLFFTLQRPAAPLVAPPQVAAPVPTMETVAPEPVPAAPTEPVRMP